ncbi:predicted protein [Naegleria gruberi]|uniref:Predicted protein n=1 Tax=Naegleria gruberi TaxID=5762 RepID=D2V2F2_NAEGR|nr:uncharacterized protein NAEGRDRAFT_46154 [Naegleria gruberi]EFC49047.1 predicted protein [Naegleria gruberi]|eukprot:XP_002681791.1 predicted protein [Naegleria gruberi strain NEG-M]
MKTTLPIRRLLSNSSSPQQQYLFSNVVVRNFSRSEITLNQQDNASAASFEEAKPMVAQARPKKKYINKILDKPLEKPLQLWFKQDKWNSDEQKRIEYIARLLMKFQYKNYQDFLETNPKQKSALEQIEEITLRDDKIIQKLLENEIKERKPQNEDEDVPVLKFNKEALSKIDPDEVTPMAAFKSIKKRKLANRTILTFPQNILPKSETEAQYAQLRLIDLLEKEKGWKLVGWKIGATQPKALVRLNIKQPFLGPIFEHQVLKNPESVQVEDVTNFGPMVEIEFGFVLAKDLKARSEPYTKEELIDALDHVKGVVEIIGTRVDNVENNGGVLTRIADLGGHINLIIPEKPSTFDKTQVAKLSFENVELFLNGESDTKAKGSFVCNGQYDPNETKGPLDTCLQCINRITGEFGRDVLAGQIISSGTMTGKSRELEKGDLIKASFENPLFDDIVFKYK